MTLLQGESQIIAILTPGGPLQVLESAHYIPGDTAPVYDMKSKLLFFFLIIFCCSESFAAHDFIEAHGLSSCSVWG